MKGTGTVAYTHLDVYKRQELGYEPSVAELAKALDMSEDKVMEIRCV